MTVRLATGTRNAKAKAYGDLLDGGYIEFRSSTQPATPETTATGVLLLKFNLNNPAFAAPSAGKVELNLPSVQLITTTGTVGWARLFTSGDVVVSDASVGTTAADIIVDTVSFVEDDGFSLSDMDYTQNMENT